MRSKHFVTYVLGAIILLGCAAPVNLGNSLQNYDNVQTDPTEDLLLPPKLSDFQTDNGAPKFKDSVAEYDRSLKSYEHYVKRTHEAIVTDEERAYATTVEAPDDKFDYAALGLTEPDCSDKYFTMPKLPPMPSPDDDGGELDSEDITEMSIKYSEDLKHYIESNEIRLRASIHWYNEVCKK